MARVYDKAGKPKPQQNKATGPKEKKGKPAGNGSGGGNNNGGGN